MSGYAAHARHGRGEDEPADPMWGLVRELLRHSSVEGDAEDIDPVVSEGVE